MQDNKAETMELELELPEGEVDIHEADVDDSIKDAPVLLSLIHISEPTRPY